MAVMTLVKAINNALDIKLQDNKDVVILEKTSDMKAVYSA